MLYIIDYVGAILLRGVNIVFHILPTQVALWMGRQVGRIVYYINTDRRAIAYSNLRAAFSKRKTPEELKELTKKVYKSLVEVFFEILTLTKVDKKYIDKYIDLVDFANLRDTGNAPEGMVALTAHYGNWELSAVISAVKGIPLIVLAREQKMKKLNGLIDRLRESKGLEVVTKGITTRYIIKSLHQGKNIGMVGDQDAGKTGVLVDFFGRPASTAPGAMRFAAKTGSYILPAFLIRIKGPYHRLVLEKPIKIGKNEDIKPYLEKYNKLLEKYITAYPEQWLWLHKRWKSTPLKKVVILDDGKVGHKNQSLAACKELNQYRLNGGFTDKDTEITSVRIKFKSNFKKMLLNVLSVFAGKRCQGCMKCVKACLTKESYDDLMKRYCDVVVSCGSSTAGLNRLFSIENKAKNIAIMKPSILSTDKFNMAIIPRHDIKFRTKKNVIVVDTVPNLIDKDYLIESSKKIIINNSPEESKRIGVLIGGDNSDFSFTEDMARKFLDNISSTSDKLNTDILITTSRRTPAKIEQLVKDKMGSSNRCKALIIANENNKEDVVGAILGLSDIIVVSGESTSMISEAVSSGKKVVVFKLSKKNKKLSKFEKLLTNLENRNFITVTSIDNIEKTISKKLNEPESYRVPEDRYNVYMNMWRVL